MKNEELLRPGEAIEPLDGEHDIIQPVDGYRFGSDAVALARFACGGIRRGAAVVDLCSGCGIIGLLLAIGQGAHVVGLELDGALCDMSVRSAAMNGADAMFINADVRTLCAADVAAYGKIDAVVCNPPFFKADSKPASVAPGANSELTVTFTDIVRAAKLILRGGGEFYTVHTATRLDEVLSVCRDASLMPKELVVNPNGKTFMLRCVLGGRAGLKVSVKEF